MYGQQLHKRANRKQTDTASNDTLPSQHRLNKLIAKILFLRQQREELLSREIYPVSTAVTFGAFYFVLAKYLYSYFIMPNAQTYFLMKDEETYNELINFVDKNFVKKIGTVIGPNPFHQVCRLLDFLVNPDVDFIPIKNQAMAEYWFDYVKNKLAFLISDLVRIYVNRRMPDTDYASLEIMHNTFNEFLADGNTHTLLVE